MHLNLYLYYKSYLVIYLIKLFLPFNSHIVLHGCIVLISSDNIQTGRKQAVYDLYADYLNHLEN